MIAMADAAPAPARFSDLRKRALSAAVLGPLALAAIWLGAWPFKVMIGLVGAVLAWEWLHLRGLRARSWPGLLVPLTVLAACLAAALERPGLALLALLAGFGCALLAAPPGLRRFLAAGVPYIGIACVALIELRDYAEAGLENVVFLVGIVWASDIGAYAAGRVFGGPKLWPRVSPSKTWAGFCGGLAAVLVVGVLLGRALQPAPIGPMLVMAVLLGLATQAGDLLESWIKRRCHVKDSSRLIPGHGGLLDRVDGLLAAAPVAALASLMIGPGVHLWRWS
jgi:phosphatidate cytidylyltransferase